jgi:predicted nucleotidyltransferase
MTIESLYLAFTIMEKKIKHIIHDYFQDKPVHKAFLFGSTARGENIKGSDIDILVELDYNNGADYFLFYDMQKELSQLLSNKVDLVSANGLSPYIKPIIDKEKVLVYERKIF